MTAPSVQLLRMLLQNEVGIKFEKSTKLVLIVYIKIRFEKSEDKGSRHLGRPSLPCCSSGESPCKT